ncbi:MAG: hypothetical protein ABS95_01655 [Verrucomicrobia bacterium SCN 57-15]|nr:MAG: hypothetical protein ABS95_01655 [Verrucomicrobia bacterium SCN 57-15]
MKRYYLTLSRLSLAVIVLQAFTFLYCGFNVEKINRRIDRVIQHLAETTRRTPILDIAAGETAGLLARFQKLNRERGWLLGGIILGGSLHVAVCYSLYIHFLRMGYTWTKLFLHANNLTAALLLPSPANLLWLLAYIIGTRVYKHFCVASGFRRNCIQV